MFRHKNIRIPRDRYVGAAWFFLTFCAENRKNLPHMELAPYWDLTPFPPAFPSGTLVEIDATRSRQTQLRSSLLADTIVFPSICNPFVFIFLRAFFTNICAAPCFLNPLACPGVRAANSAERKALR